MEEKDGGGRYMGLGLGLGLGVGCSSGRRKEGKGFYSD